MYVYRSYRRALTARQSSLQPRPPSCFKHHHGIQKQRAGGYLALRRHPHCRQTDCVHVDTWRRACVAIVGVADASRYSRCSGMFSLIVKYVATRLICSNSVDHVGTTTTAVSLEDTLRKISRSKLPWVPW